MTLSDLTIGQLAQRVGLNPKTIRYYEEIGLLAQPARNEAGYRLYSNKDLSRLRFIQRAKMLGLSLAEVKQLLEYADGGRCGLLQERLQALVEEKLVEVKYRLAELTAFRDDLQSFHNALTSKLETTDPKSSVSLDAASCSCIELGQASREYSETCRRPTNGNQPPDHIIRFNGLFQDNLPPYCSSR